MGPNKCLGELGGKFSKYWDRDYSHCRKMVGIDLPSIYVIKITTENTEITERDPLETIVIHTHIACSK